MSVFDPLGDLLPAWIGYGQSFAEQRRRDDYQKAMENQWLSQQAQRAAELKARQQETLDARRYDTERSALDWQRRQAERAEDRNHASQREAQQDSAMSETVRQWVESQQWKTPADKQRALTLGLAAVRAKMANPFGAMDDSAGRVKPVDPLVAAQRDIATQNAGLLREQREHLNRQRNLNTTTTDAAAYLKRYGVDPTPQAISSFLKYNPSFNKAGFSQPELDVGIGNLMGVEAGRQRPRFGYTEDPYAGMSEEQITDKLIEEADAQGMSEDDARQYVTETLSQIRLSRQSNK